MAELRGFYGLVRQIYSIFRALALAVLIAFAIWGAAHAAESPPVISTRATVSLVSDFDRVQPGQTLRIGLRFQLAPGWHIYWRNPGDAGAPPTLSLNMSPGARAAELEWPTPVRLREGPVMTYGYTGQVLLPMRVTNGADGLHIDADANWLVCSNICVPEQGVFHLDLPSGAPLPSAEAPQFAVAKAEQPIVSPFVADIGADGWLSVRGQGLSASNVADAWFFPDQPGLLKAAAPQDVQMRTDLLRLHLPLTADFKSGQMLRGVLVLRDPTGQERSLAIAAPPALKKSAGFLWLLISAFLAGILLNLMPCVFPILAMKALALAHMAGAEKARVRRHAFAYTAGVLVCFAALGGIVLLLRLGGATVGWGFQFQSPGFVAVMAWLLFVVGLNLSGVFEFGATLVGTGQGIIARGGLAGSFGTGLLAVVVATPCTAPFMGAALAAASVAPAPQAMAVFLMLGLGLAAPYALLTVFPGMARVFPHPGFWMEALRECLAFPMYGATAWLLWVLSMQAGPTGVILSGTGLVVLGFAAWLTGLGQRSGKRLGWVGAGLAVLVMAALVPRISVAPKPETDAGADRFSNARLAALRADGRPVFVDMTASWCVTCLVNDHVALGSAQVRAAFAAHHVVYLQGDWTQRDPEISDFLHSFGRDGVPLYVYFPPKGEPSVLPQILTPDMVAKAVAD